MGNVDVLLCYYIQKNLKKYHKFKIHVITFGNLWKVETYELEYDKNNNLEHFECLNDGIYVDYDTLHRLFYHCWVTESHKDFNDDSILVLRAYYDERRN